MKFQADQASCGAAAMSNALSAMGVSRTEAECAALCGTSTDGTSAKGLLRGLRLVEGLDPSAFREARQDVAILRLYAALHQGRPVILCVDQDEHWVAAVGLLAGRVLVVDSADNELVVSYLAGALAVRWGGPGTKPYFGVIL
jgi:hypothetical protein